TVLVPGSFDETQQRLRLWLLARALHLSPTQKKQVEAITSADAAEVLSIRRASEPALAPIRARQTSKIRDVLPQEQRAEFDLTVKAAEAERRRACGPAP